MRIGFDIDGVLADFVTTYQRMFVQLTGTDLFKPGDNTDPPCWDWPQYRGYTDATVGKVWAAIRQDPTFWLNLTPTRHVDTLKLLLRDLERKHEVYFVTSRVGARVKRQTEIWLVDHHVGYGRSADALFPTVLIVGSNAKGDVAKSLRLDCYIDDNYDNVQDVAVKSPGTRTYLLNATYNRQTSFDAGAATGSAPNLQLRPYPDVSPLVARCDSLSEMFDTEIANL